MTEFAEQYGKYALIAGASEGIGAEFARQIAERKLGLVLLARRKEPLTALAEELRARNGVDVRIAAVDLGAPDLLTHVRAATEGLEVGLVVYNAAVSMIGPFFKQPLADKLRIIDVNCRGPIILADELGRRMAARGRGGIILMASLAGSQGSPLVATYAATKAFNLVLGESLWDELRQQGLDVIACRAGATRTPGYQASKPQGKVPIMDPGPVAEEALEALGRRPSVIPGFVNRMSDFFLGRLMPRKLAVTIMGKATRQLYPSEAKQLLQK
jgi:short-subunit dehydrogenase